MPEYLSPGVYIEEVSFRGHPIEGVSTSTADFIGGETVARLESLARDSGRAWSDEPHQDPGVHLLELLSFVAERLTCRTGMVPELGLLHASRLAAAALALIANHPSPSGCVLKHAMFFPGKRLVEHVRVAGAAIAHKPEPDGC